MSSKKDMQVMWMIKALLACYIVTILLLLLMSFLFYKWHLSEQAVTGGIVASYAISTLVGGFIAGKVKGERKTTWGLVIGIIYYLFLLSISYGVHGNIEYSWTDLVTIFLLCSGGGMLGGRLS